MYRPLLIALLVLAWMLVPGHSEPVLHFQSDATFANTFHQIHIELKQAALR